MTKNNYKDIYLLFHRIINNKIENNRYFEDVYFEIFDETVKRVDAIQKQEKNKTNYFITFDDGYASCYHEAIGKLIESDIKAIFFIVPKFIGKEDYLSWSMIREMSAYGAIFGSHSYSHQDLTTVSNDILNIELITSKNIIEQKIGSIVSDFSYPYGKYNEATNIAVLEAGYNKIYNSNRGVNNTSSIIINRNSINSLFNQKKIETILRPNYINRIFWYLENLSKKNIKLVIGDENYLKLRDWIN